ncbi:PD-(D/E)XK nuclease family protein [Flavobacteriales bacterium]|nr:PD-(D/E)XK nuclease family protein [Flavobacteriales bacterium]
MTQNSIGTYNRLIKLFSNGDSSKTPLEDYTTEILAGILDTHRKSLLKIFLSEILCVNEEVVDVENMKISTRSSYDLPDSNPEKIVYPDLILENDKMRCFIENKVEASEGENQLKNYAKILSKLDDNKANYLRYCTKYYDPKAIDGEIDFKQFRWSDISEMLKVEIKEVENTSNTPFQLNDFYSFLKYNNMTKHEEINLEHLKNLTSTIKTLDDILIPIKFMFEKALKIGGSAPTITSLKKYRRYTSTFKIKKGIEIGVGFDLTDDVPIVKVWLTFFKFTVSSKIIRDSMNQFDWGDKLPEINDDGLAREYVFKENLDKLKKEEKNGDKTMEILIEEWFHNKKYYIKEINEMLKTLK